jgi:diadenylate cyclase
MEVMLENIRYTWDYIRMMGWQDFIDILIVAIVIYQLIRFMRFTSTFRVIWGILLLLLLMWISDLLDMRMLTVMLRYLGQVGGIALIILFQPELRKLLERIGGNVLSGVVIKTAAQANQTEKVIDELVEACAALSWAREGALIVITRAMALDDVVETGTIVDAAVSAELVRNIFYPKAPLHDGALIIRDGRMVGAGCMLPLSSNENLSRGLGMRHRAGIGISETTDALAIIVSEETGSISVSSQGMLKRHLAQETLKKLLRNELLHDDDRKKSILGGIVERMRGGKPRG